MSNEQLYKKYDNNIPMNYERYFVPVIGKPLAEDLIDIAHIKPGENVLDIACGTGIATRYALQKAGPEGSVAGLDPNPGMLAVARKIAENSNSIEWYESSAEAIPLPDNSFDVVLCQLGLQFIDEKDIALKEIFRVLKPSGRLILNVPGPEQEMFAIFSDAIKNNINPKAAEFAKRVFSLGNVQELRFLLKKAGFDDPEIQEYEKTFELPETAEFLWQYIFSTPLATFMTETDEQSLLNLQSDVSDGWEVFRVNGGLEYRQPIISVQAHKNRQPDK